VCLKKESIVEDFLNREEIMLPCDGVCKDVLDIDRVSEDVKVSFRQFLCKTLGEQKVNRMEFGVITRVCECFGREWSKPHSGRTNFMRSL